MNILSEVVNGQSTPPSGSLNVLEHKACARNGLITMDDSRRKDCIVDLDVAQGDILESYEVVCLTWCKRIKKTSWTFVTTMLPRLTLLLRTNIDSPPDRIEYFQVIV